MLRIKENPGSMPVEQMRDYFERAIKNTKVFADSTPLGIMEINGKFSHYMDPHTDTMWLGFAIGLRCAERMSITGRAPGNEVDFDKDPEES